MLSGSGPIVIALALEGVEDLGAKMVELFADEGIKARYLITEPTNQGAEIINN